MSRVKHPPGVPRGALVETVRELRTKGGNIFPVGTRLVVGGATTKHRVMLYREIRNNTIMGCIMNVECSAYRVIDAEPATSSQVTPGGEK